ncbi:hypothetical protein [Clostridium sp. DJ247]|uniref:hypothetical protein n=1 Tax=Clostridium sp. DJ247 TaxID=2726188 RepID=UPI00162A0A58|nr:hypothetical protein [Clostridium sp. DJ247]MBC2581497.1 hypothetical protein [Clostridium sp. DJ247]
MKEILNSVLTINKSETKTHRSLKFIVNEDKKILKLEFDYFPKIVSKVEDIIQAFENHGNSFTSEESNLLKEKFIRGEEKLKNLATLSLYNKSQYIGCAHRHEGKQIIIISQKESTQGFIKAPIEAGQWEIVISFHGVFTDNMKIFLKAYIE